MPASFIGRIGSFWITGMTRPRPTTSSGVEKAPFGTLLAGHSTTCRSSAFSWAPSSRSVAATTTGLVGIDTVFTGTFCM